ncbi:MAG: sigma-70 family RNA polymerase sigma factor [Planctomycetota bacterium]
MLSSVTKIRTEVAAPPRLRLLRDQRDDDLMATRDSLEGPSDQGRNDPDEGRGFRAGEHRPREAEGLDAPDPQEDRRLAARFLDAQREGRREAMEQCFRMLLVRHQERIHKLVYRYVRDPQEAEDVTQEVFVKVYRKLGSFQWDSAFTTWLYRVAVNTASDWVAKRRRRPIHLSEDVQVLVGPDGPETAAKGYQGPSVPAAPDARLLEEERARVTRALLDELPENYRRVLVLREYEELSYLEMAEVLGCSLGTIESRLFRARARFRKLLEERHPDLLR